MPCCFRKCRSSDLCYNLLRRCEEGVDGNGDKMEQEKDYYQNEKTVRNKTMSFHRKAKKGFQKYIDEIKVL